MLQYTCMCSDVVVQCEKHSIGDNIVLLRCDSRELRYKIWCALLFWALISLLPVGRGKP